MTKAPIPTRSVQTTPAPILPALLSVDDLAEYLGCSKHFVYKLTSKKRIAFFKAGGRVRFTHEQVATYLASIGAPVAVPGQGAPGSAGGVLGTAGRVGRPRRTLADLGIDLD